MANNTQIVRKSLLKSSISLQTINKSVTFLSKDLKRSTNLLQNAGKVQEEDNKFQRALIGRENTWFNRRREQVLRREKEDITEAATVGGAIKRRGKVVGSSTKGFLGRILDVFGILFIGWLTSNLPPILRAVNNMIDLIQKTVSILSGFINNTVGFFNSLGAGLDNVLSNLTVGFRFDKDTETIKKGFDDMNRGTSMFSADIDSSIASYLNPGTYGRDNWDIPKDESDVNKPKGAGRNFGGLVDFATFGLTDLDKRGNLFGGRHGRTGFTNVDGTEFNEELIEEEQQKTDTVKVEPKDTLVKGANEDKKDREIDNDSAIANDPKADLELRFDNGYIPKKDSSDYDQYKEWLNAPGGLEMFKDGGIIKGKPHSQGGEDINVEGGEAVIPKKRVEQYGPEYINAIIQGNADNVTKLRAGRSALEKAVEDFKEANDGIIKYDEYKRIEAETYGRVKAHLKTRIQGTQGKTSDQVTPKQQSEPKIEVSKSKVNKIASGDMRKKRKVVKIPIPNNNQQPQQPIAPPSGRKMNSGKPRPSSRGLHIGDLQSLMLAYT